MIKEDIQVYVSRFLLELEKFLKLQIRKGTVTSIDIDDINIIAKHMYNAMVDRKKK